MKPLIKFCVYLFFFFDEGVLRVSEERTQRKMRWYMYFHARVTYCCLMIMGGYVRRATNIFLYSAYRFLSLEIKGLATRNGNG